MTIFYAQVKKAGSKKHLAKIAYYPNEDILSLRALLTYLVKKEVAKYNAKSEHTPMLMYLSEKDIEDAAQSGKVGFGYVYGDKKADEKKAIENAIACYKDGLVRVFRNEVELTNLDESLDLHENDVVTIIRLVFLAGRMG